MLKAAVMFFLFGLCAFLLGAYNIAGISLEIGRLAMFVFLVLSVISFFSTLISRKKTHLM